MTAPELTLAGIVEQLRDGEEFRIRRGFDTEVRVELTDATVPFSKRLHVARTITRFELERLRVPHYALLVAMEGLLRAYRSAPPQESASNTAAPHQPPPDSSGVLLGHD